MYYRKVNINVLGRESASVVVEANSVTPVPFLYGARSGDNRAVIFTPSAVQRVRKDTPAVRGLTLALVGGGGVERTPSTWVFVNS